MARRAHTEWGIAAELYRSLPGDCRFFRARQTGQLSPDFVCSSWPRSGALPPPGSVGISMSSKCVALAQVSGLRRARNFRSGLTRACSGLACIAWRVEGASATPRDSVEVAGAERANDPAGNFRHPGEIQHAALSRSTNKARAKLTGEGSPRREAASKRAAVDSAGEEAHSPAPVPGPPICSRYCEAVLRFSTSSPASILILKIQPSPNGSVLTSAGWPVRASLTAVIVPEMGE